MAKNINKLLSPDLIPVISLRMRHGWTGFGIYCALVHLLAQQPDAAVPADYAVLAFHLRIAEETVKSIVEDFGLFEFETVGGIRRIFIPQLRPKPVAADENPTQPQECEPIKAEEKSNTIKCTESTGCRSGSQIKPIGFTAGLAPAQVAPAHATSGQSRPVSPPQIPASPDIICASNSS